MKKFNPLVAVIPILLLSGCYGPDCFENEIIKQRILLDNFPSDEFGTANIFIEDINGDGEPEIFVTEPHQGRLTILEGCEDECQEINYSEGLIEPIRARPGDINQDGFMDLVVADIGSTFPSTELVGRVVIFYGEENASFLESTRMEVVLSNVGRVTCAEISDLDDDGDLDIVVCEFGHLNGSIMWLEQTDNGTFITHLLDDRPGAIHAIPHDVDNDGDIDIAAVVSQLSEEVVLFTNQNGSFSQTSLFDAEINYFGMTGLFASDIDDDGDIDLLFTNGAQWDGDTPFGVDLNEIHGLRLLRNDGTGTYSLEVLIHLFGAYSVAVIDQDKDGDLDIFIGTHQMNQAYPRAHNVSLVLLEQNGNNEFEAHYLQSPVSGLMAISPGYENLGLLLVGSYFPNDLATASRLSVLDFTTQEICDS